MDIIITLTQDEFDRAAVALKTLKRLDDLDENVTDEDIVKACIHSYIRENVISHEVVFAGKSASEAARDKAEDEVLVDKGVEDLPRKEIEKPEIPDIPIDPVDPIDPII